MEVKKIEGKAPGASEDTAFTIGFKMPVRPIDACAMMAQMSRKKSGVADKRFTEGFNDAIIRLRSMLHSAPTLSLNTLRDAIYQDAVAHGLWEDTEKTALAWSKEEPPSEQERYYTLFRRTQAAKLVFFEGDELLSAAEEENWDNLQEELADVVIQAFSTAGYLGIDIDAAIRRKMEINKNRAWKHGKE